MPRYIDAEKHEELCDMMKKEGDSFSEVLWNQFKILVQWQPCADVKKVVRCKDCKRAIDDEPGMVYCPNIVGGWCSEDWFCKSGERREE